MLILGAGLCSIKAVTYDLPVRRRRLPALHTNSSGTENRHTDNTSERIARVCFYRQHRMYNMQTIVTDDRGVCLSPAQLGRLHCAGVIQCSLAKSLWSLVSFSIWQRRKSIRLLLLMTLNIHSTLTEVIYGASHQSRRTCTHMVVFCLPEYKTDNSTEEQDDDQRKQQTTANCEVDLQVKTDSQVIKSVSVRRSHSYQGRR